MTKKLIALASTLSLPALTFADIGMMPEYGGGYGMSGFGILFVLTWLVWLTVGILLAVWLWQHINKK